MSVVVRELDERHAMLPLATAVAVCEAAESCAAVSCAIKWPNDVWIDGRKLAGILVEGRPQEGWAVVGVGINVTSTAADFPPELRETATSLAIESHRTEAPSGETVLAALLGTLAARLSQGPDRILEDWRGRDALLGSRIKWNGGAGTAAGVDDSGALLVDTDGGRVTLDAGEVHLRSPTVGRPV
jgi:BirA family biotin operon repressor/biotin-[acetyl-CoA-carboxylase] ligase